MIRRDAYRFVAVVRCLTIAILEVALTASVSSAQGRDRTAPTAPANLHVTAVTSYTVSLAWIPSTDNSGSFAYRLEATGWPSGGTTTIGQAATTFTFRSEGAGHTYTFRLRAVDAAGNQSKPSNGVTVTLPGDKQAPTAPVLSVAGVMPSTVSLSWTPAIDDGPYVSYQVFINGAPAVWAGGVTSITVPGLTPSTAYTFSVQGRDNWQNWSPVSNEVSAVTEPSNPNDTTPPTPPANLRSSEFDCEVALRWTQSTDDEDPQPVIKYEVSVNGRLDHVVIGRGRTDVYGDVSGSNTFGVIAVDVAGNRSAPATLTLNLTGCSF
jgi:chitodextrinase